MGACRSPSCIEAGELGLKSYGAMQLMSFYVPVVGVVGVVGAGQSSAEGGQNLSVKVPRLFI